ncbi:hypothetical protein [Corynebacterium sp. FDAARGOS 1242]|uniref:hypothetical protein n=1 Tax=Corynebacterium sp. FDAARGOS 1242 TaxID=2778078 RepID=UPI001EF31665|nr:hypothetical protein [Corynebacterium sp. FDAARGOS 1242]
MLIGLGLEAVGVLILVLLMGLDTNGWIIAAPLTLYGLGLGFASAQLTGTMLRDTPVDDSGQASATQTTVRLGQWSLVAATAFFALSFVGALRALRAAGEKGARKQRRSRCPR